MSDYGSIIGAVCNGCLVDSGLHNIDGGAVNPSALTMIGKAVRVVSNEYGVRIVDQEFDIFGNPYGIVLMPHDCECVDSYNEGEPINVVTRGKVWVEVPDIDDAPEWNDPVFVLRDGTLSNSGAPTGWKFTGDFVRRGRIAPLAGVQL